MKIKPSLFILLLAIIIGNLSCLRHPNCDSSKEKYLGRIDYTFQLKQFNMENTNNSITFSNAQEELVFTKNNNIAQEPRRLNDYKVCESLNIKPYMAYAYYEYDNLESVYMVDGGILVTSPEIEKLGDKRGESFYINFGKEGVGNIKARIPITNIDTTITYQPFGELFTFQKRMTIGDKPFEDIWFFRKENMGMYYSKEVGVVALEANGVFYYRN